MICHFNDQLHNEISECMVLLIFEATLALSSIVSHWSIKAGLERATEIKPTLVLLVLFLWLVNVPTSFAFIVQKMAII